MNGVWNDVRYGFRLLKTTPGFTVVAVLTLALGIGANTAIFSVVHGVLLRPLPFPHAERLVVLCETHPSVADFCIASPPDVEDWSAQSRTLESVGIGRDWPFILKAEGGAQGLDGGIATPGYFDSLGISAALGRLFTREDLEPGRRRVVVLSHELWKGRFGSDPRIVGRLLPMGSGDYTVIGVLPEGLRVPRLEQVEIWAPPQFDPRDEQNRGWRGFRAFGRLAEGATVAQATEEISVIGQRLAMSHPETNQGWGVRVVSLRDHVVGGVRANLWLFLGAVSFVLLIGCANVANLLLARATRRRKELAMRTALGARPVRLVRMLLIESLLLSILGGAAGVLLAVWAVEAFLSVAPGGIPRLDEVGVDGGVLLFTAALSVATSMLFGLVPSLGAVRFDLYRTLKQGDSAGRGRRGGLGGRSPILIAEVALALVLLVGAGLLGRTFLTLVDWQPGFDRENLITVWLLAPSGKYDNASGVVALFERGAEEIRALPGVVSVGATSSGPLFGGVETDAFTIEGRPTPAAGEEPVARWFDVGPGYFETLGLPIRRGRAITRDDRRGAMRVAVINETMARRYWGDKDPLGQRVTMYGRAMQIVGVVADVRPMRRDRSARPEIYWPQAQSPRYASFLLIRTRSDPEAVARPARRRLLALEPDLDVSGFVTLDQRLGRRLVDPRFNMLLVGVFSVVALVLAGIGVYGVIAYAVAQRTHEIGIRVALGARRADILRSVIAQGMRPALIGVGIGLVAAFFLTRLMTTLLYGVPPIDLPTFLAVAAILVLVALAACYFPARAATRVDAVVALRQE